MIDTSIIQDFHEFVSTEFPAVDINTVELQFYTATGKPNYSHFDLWVELEDYPFKHIVMSGIIEKLEGFFKSKDFVLDIKLSEYADYLGFGISVIIYFQVERGVSIMVY